MSEQGKTITVDGAEYNLADLSENVQTAVALYNQFNGDLQGAQAAAQAANTEVLKLQFAMQSLAGQISHAVKDEVAAKAATDVVVEDVDVQAE